MNLFAGKYLDDMVHAIMAAEAFVRMYTDEGYGSRRSKMSENETGAVCAESVPPIEIDLNLLPRISPGLNRKIGTVVNVPISDGKGGTYLSPHFVAFPRLGAMSKEDFSTDEIENCVPPIKEILEASKNRRTPVHPKLPIQLLADGKRYAQDIRFHRIDIPKLMNDLATMQQRPSLPPPAWVILKPKWWVKMTESRLCKILLGAKKLFSRKAAPKNNTELVIAR